MATIPEKSNPRRKTDEEKDGEKMGKRIMVTLMAVMLLMASSMTAMAAYKADQNSTYFGSVSTSGTQASANTKNKTGAGPVYVSIRAHYRTSSGGQYWSDRKSSSSASDYVNLVKSFPGTVIGAESAHGPNAQNIAFIITV